MAEISVRETKELLYYRNDAGILPGVAARIASVLSEKACNIRRMAMVERVTKKGHGIRRQKCGTIRMYIIKDISLTIKNEVTERIGILTQEFRKNHRSSVGDSTFAYASDDSVHSDIPNGKKSQELVVIPARFSCQLLVSTPTDENGFSKTLHAIFGTLFATRRVNGLDAFNIEHLAAFRRYAYNSPLDGSNHEYLVDFQFRMENGNFQTNLSEFEQFRVIRALTELTEWIVVNLSGVRGVREVYCHPVEGEIAARCPKMRALPKER